MSFRLFIVNLLAAISGFVSAILLFYSLAVAPSRSLTATFRPIRLRLAKASRRAVTSTVFSPAASTSSRNFSPSSSRISLPKAPASLTSPTISAGSTTAPGACVAARAVLGGLHHEYRWERITA